MAKKTYTAVAANEHTISVFDTETGTYHSSIFITSGKIIGQPLVSANTITVTYTEGGNNFMGIYDSHTLSFIRTQSLS